MAESIVCTNGELGLEGIACFACPELPLSGRDGWCRRNVPFFQNELEGLLVLMVAIRLLETRSKILVV